MDLFALGTPVMDHFAKVKEADLKKLNAKMGATNYFTAGMMKKAKRTLGKKLSYSYPGDNARNVCEGFAALGGFCGYAGAIGSDKAGALFFANLDECGIANFLEEKKGATGEILALVTEEGQRTFCADLGVSDKCKGFDRLAAQSSRMLYLSSITIAANAPVAKLALKYIEYFRKNGKMVAISIENPPMVEKRRAFLLSVAKKYADALFLNEDEARALFGEGAEGKLMRLKPSIPIYLKKGKEGSLLFLEGKTHKIAPLAAIAVDTTGAGDAYAAGALYGLSRKYTPLSAGKIGCFLATKVVEKFGAGIPFSHIRQRMRHDKTGKPR
jgi:sugar/nucleoside kinase (ribokinase family)